MNYEETIEKIQALIKDERYQEALERTIALKQTRWNDVYLHHLINKLTPKLRKQEKKRRVNFIKEGIRTIKTLKKEKKYEEAIKACREILEVDQRNGDVIELLQTSKVGFINEKLKDPIQKKWMEEGKYEKLYLFYQKLRKIFPEHPQLEALLKQAERKVIEKDRKIKKKFAEESIKRLWEMFAQGYYEQVIMGAEELIHFTHGGSPAASDLLKKARKENLKEIERDIYAYMERQQPLLKANFEAGEEPMIKV